MKISYALLLPILLFANLLNAQQFHITEDFNLSSLPTGWTNTAISGTQNWSFGIDGAGAHAGSQNLNGSAMAYFDDDALGGSSTNNTVSLTTPVFDNSSDSITTLEFEYNFRKFGGINTPDLFYVEVFGGAVWDTVFSVNMNNCGSYLTNGCINNFPHAVVDISSYANSNCQVRFSYHDGNDWSWYIGIDNVVISSSLDNDMQVSEILSLQNNCGLSASESILIKIKNIGNNSITSPFVVTLDVNYGSQILKDTLSIPISFGDSINYTFTNTANLSALGNYELKSYTNYSLDLNLLNDTSRKLVRHESLFTIPFFDDFEEQNNWKTSGVNNSWNLGIPSGSFIDTASSGIKAYVTNLSGNYNDNEVSFLTSPCFDFSSSISDPFISFDLIYKTELGFDSLTLESSIDGGISWQKVNKYIISDNFFQSNKTYWDSTSSGWINVRNRLQNLKGESNVKLRFKFQTDLSGVLEGVGIDNFEITNGNKTDLMLNNVVLPSPLPTCRIDSSSITARVTNLGIHPIDTFYLFYQANGGNILIDTLIQALIPDQPTYISSLRKLPLNSSNNDINLWIKTPKDTSHLNDSILNYTFINNSSTIFPFPYQEDFDSLNINGNIHGWQRNTSINHNYYTWRIAAIRTSSSTGPANDVTGNNYLYTKSSHGSIGDDATLTSLCIQLNHHENIVLGFYTHRYGTDIDSLYVDFYNGTNWNTIDTIVGQQQISQNSPWTRHELSIKAVAYSVVKIRFRTKRIGFYGYIALDKVQLFVESDLDAAITELTSPADQCYLSNNEVVKTTIYNDGIQDILPNTLSVSYEIDNNTTVTELITDTVKANDTLSYSFNQLANLSNYGTTYSLTIFSSLVGDLNSFNDTLTTQITNLTNTANYKEDFENSNKRTCLNFSTGYYNSFLPLGWSDSSSSWYVQNTSNCSFGYNQGATQTPTTGPSGAHNGTNFLYLDAGQSLFLNKVLKTNCFDFTNDSNITLEFWYHKYGVGMADLFIEVENNQGIISVVDSIIGQTHPSHAASWLKKVISLNSFAGQQITIQFRAKRMPSSFFYTSDMAIDDIRIFNPLTVSIEEPKAQNLFSLYPNPNSGLFTLKVSNKTVGSMYSIFDMKGSVIKSSIINSPTSQIQLNEVDKGIYFIQVEGFGKTEKIVIQ